MKQNLTNSNRCIQESVGHELSYTAPAPLKIFPLKKTLAFTFKLQSVVLKPIQGKYYFHHPTIINSTTS